MASTNILLVDDNPVVLDFLSLILAVAGYHILTAQDGLEALDILEEQPVNLILADISMPGLNGYELLERVRSHPVWTAIPFVFITGRDLNSEATYARQLGVDRYLTKPIQSWELLSTVRHNI